ncbi:phage regulatory CII family protein [Halomonas caseinilytica]|uniref:phage regulatory CII family protein n=1 Tax=Halomonas caseinilytica TaxID=438744 RepID=UPI0007E58E67|nr:phage regulatory CII family protein [Halomonas caseinilytica]
MSKRWPSSVDRAQREVLPLNLSLYHAAREYPGGAKAIAAIYGLNATTLQHRLSPTHEPHRIDLDSLEAVLGATHDDRILDSIGELAGGAIWMRPDDCHAESSFDLIQLISVLHDQLGEMLGSVCETTRDGIVDDRERAELRMRARRLMQAVLALEVAAVNVGDEYDG